MGEPTVVAPGILRLSIESPAALLGEPTNCYLISTPLGALVVDPASPEPAVLEEIEGVAEEMGGIGGIAVTHGHADHTAGVAPLWRRHGGWVATHPELIGRISGLPEEAYRRIREGNRLAGLHVLETPGHKRDHVTFWRTDASGRRIMVVGDVVAGEGTTIINPPEGDLAAYLETLRRLLAMAPSMLLPGHGPAVDAPAQALEWLIDHRLERERALLAVLGPEPQPLRELVRQVYTDVDSARWGLAERSLLAHLLKLQAEGRARETEEGWKQSHS